MDLFASIFDSKCKCNRCGHLFKLTSKRRKCVICSNPYSELIFCKRCSLKVTKHGFFSSKRYCEDCHRRETEQTSGLAPDLRKMASIEDAAADIGISNEELLRNRNQIEEVVSLVNNGVRSMPHTSSVMSR